MWCIPESLFPLKIHTYIYIKIENIAAIWTWKAGILLAPKLWTPQSQPHFHPFLDWWIAQKLSRSIQGCMNFIFSFWTLYETCNSVYKTMLWGSEQRKQLVFHSYPCSEFCLLPSSQYNWVNNDYSCRGINAYMEEANQVA